MKKLLSAGLGALAVLAMTAPGVHALDDLSNYVFVPNRASADVAVIDTRTDAVVARVRVGEVPHQVAVSPALGKMVVTNTADDTISVIDLATLETTATIPLGHEPEHMELDPTGDVLAVGNIGEGTVSLVSLRDERELARVDGLHEPHNMTFSPSGERLYVGNLGASFVSLIDVPQATVAGEIAVGPDRALAHHEDDDTAYQGIINVTATPDGRLGFAAYGEGDRMAVIDLESGRTLKDLALGDTPWRAFTTTDGRYMIVPNNGDETVSVVSTETLERGRAPPRRGRHDRRQHRPVRYARLCDQPGRRQGAGDRPGDHAVRRRGCPSRHAGDRRRDARWHKALRRVERCQHGRRD